MSAIKDIYWEEICNGQSEAKLAEKLDNSYQEEIREEREFEERTFEEMAERSKFFDIFGATGSYPF